MMSLFSKIFGGGKPKEPEAPQRDEAITYEGFLISAAPLKADNGQWRVAAYITKQLDVPIEIPASADSEAETISMLERQLIRADVSPSREGAAEQSIHKAKQVIDQQGERLFADGKPTGRA